MNHMPGGPPIQGGSELETRRDVAACYRLISLYGMSDFSDGFASARIPDAPDEFIVGGYGLLPELALASKLHRRTLADEPLLEKFTGVDTDAHLFTRTSLAARPDINACIHAHPVHITAMSALDCELEPMSQWGIMYHRLIAVMPFTTTDVTAPECCEEMSGMLASGAQAIILRNHGIVVTGRSMAEAFFALSRIELACQLQLMAMSAGRPLAMPGANLVPALQKTYWTMTRVDNDGSREWPGLLDKLDRLDASYRD